MNRKPLLALLLLLASPVVCASAAPTTETPNASTCEKPVEDSDTDANPPPPTGKPAGTAAAPTPLRSSTPTRSATPRWNSLLPGMFR